MGGENLIIYGSTSWFRDAVKEGVPIEQIASVYGACQDYHGNGATMVAQIRALNPRFTPLLYWNPKGVDRGLSGENKELWELYVAKGWVLKDQYGDYVHDNFWTNLFMVDIGNSDYQDFVVNRIAERIFNRNYGGEPTDYDGLMADTSFDVSAGLFSAGKSGIPLNPRTGVAWTDEEVMNAFLQLHHKIRQTLGNRLFIPNGLWTGWRFWEYKDRYLRYFPNVDGAVFEGLWTLFNRDGTWKTDLVNRWVESLDALVWLQDNYPQKYFVVAWMLEPLEGIIPLDMTVETLFMLGYTSTLLGLKPYSRVFLGPKMSVKSLIQYGVPLINIDVGFPITDYYRVENSEVFARDFRNVKVLVNPSNVAYTLNLGKQYVTRTGEKVTQITMEPHRGEILLTPKPSIIPNSCVRHRWSSNTNSGVEKGLVAEAIVILSKPYPTDTLYAKKTILDM